MQTESLEYTGLVIYMRLGISAVLNRLIEGGLVDGSTFTVTGQTLAENVKNAKVMNNEVIRPLDQPYSKTGGIAVLKGNLAPDGAVVKQAGVAQEMLTHKGPARVYNSEEEAFSAIMGGKINKGDVVIVRYEGPKGGPGMGMLSPTCPLAGLIVMWQFITDGRSLRQQGSYWPHHLKQKVVHWSP